MLLLGVKVWRFFVFVVARMPKTSLLVCVCVCVGGGGGGACLQFPFKY